MLTPDLSRDLSCPRSSYAPVNPLWLSTCPTWRAGGINIVEPRTQSGPGSYAGPLSIAWQLVDCMAFASTDDV